MKRTTHVAEISALALLLNSMEKPEALASVFEWLESVQAQPKRRKGSESTLDTLKHELNTLKIQTPETQRKIWDDAFLKHSDILGYGLYRRKLKAWDDETEFKNFLERYGDYSVEHLRGMNFSHFITQKLETMLNDEKKERMETMLSELKKGDDVLGDIMNLVRECEHAVYGHQRWNVMYPIMRMAKKALESMEPTTAAIQDALRYFPYCDAESYDAATGG